MASTSSGSHGIDDADRTSSPSCPHTDVTTATESGISISYAPAGAVTPSTSPRPLQQSQLRPSSLDRDSVEGYMVLHVKKPRKKLFSLARPAFYVVADARKNVLEVFSSESKSELIYVLSLTNAVLSFESDDANMVMEKCFCVEAKTWKKRNTVTFKRQAFVFFEESQVRMLLWVKCIHVAIKRASNVAADRDLFRSSGAASNTSDSPHFTDDDEQQHYGGNGEDSESTCPDGNEASSSSGHYGGQNAVRRRLVIEPHAAMASQKEPKTSFNRLNAMFSTHKQQLKSPKSSETTTTSNNNGYSNHKESKTTAAAAVCALLSPKMLNSSPAGSSLSSSASSAATKNPFHYNSASSKSIGATVSSNSRSHAVHSESSAVRKRVERSSGSSSSTTTAAASSLNNTTDAYYEDVRSSRLREYAIPPKIHRYNYQIGTRADSRSTYTNRSHNDDDMDTGGSPDPNAPGQTLDTKVAFVLSRCMVLWVAFLGGVVEASIFLPIAAAGVFVNVCRLDDELLWSTLAMLGVYLVSRVQGSLGVVAIFVTLYLWSYAEFKNQRRRRRVRVADLLLQEESESFAHVDVRRVYMLFLVLNIYLLTKLGGLSWVDPQLDLPSGRRPRRVAQQSLRHVRLLQTSSQLAQPSNLTPSVSPPSPPLLYRGWPYLKIAIRVRSTGTSLL